MCMAPIVLATGNPHKVEELRAIFGRVGVSVVGLKEVAPEGIPEPAETGGTFEANATIKAVYYAAQTGRVCLADDSGLEVDALGGAPGVISSHYATDGMETGASRAARDAANNARLLREMEGVEEERRTARFVCVMVLAGPVGLLPRGTVPLRAPVLEIERAREGHRPEACATVFATTWGRFEGRIGRAPDVPRGKNGFGYDPLFVLPSPETRTSAELLSEEKNARSHRGAAARAMAEALRRV